MVALAIGELVVSPKETQRNDQTQGGMVMAIAKDDLVEGGIYVTPMNQLRQITEINGDEVHYQSKSGNYPSRSWWGHPKTNAPSIETFCADVDRRLTIQEIDAYIASSVLTAEDRK
jgi:hypothetical protein